VEETSCERASGLSLPSREIRVDSPRLGVHLPHRRVEGLDPGREGASRWIAVGWEADLYDEWSGLEDLDGEEDA
jgi:hypothetical protein